ncbi:MAG: septal ring lytic transglycosylase RlpA family protein [Candidatus Fermentibacteraceae bacterium]|nr:septal ring lytic transglycosylase RlpA family protein [Candidatus Fermentibacteraceae bacterium]MBN2608756.1 septal ring lytic transglycosylase RlpA family protein [Candidatus Fermentibacteraceae bacterium]
MRSIHVLLCGVLLLAGCYLESSPVYRSAGVSAGASTAGFRQRGTASYYGEGFHGRLTASGETFDMYALTCAHLTLPFGTMLKVVNLDNDREVTVRVNDRGPYVGGRIVDLSYGAADRLGMLQAGTASVQLSVVEQ